MSNTAKLISSNIKRLRVLKKLSQKEISAIAGVPQSQYSRIENGKVEPSVAALDKLAKAFYVSVAEFFASESVLDEPNLSIIEKLRLISTLEDDEKNALFKLIDLAVSNKRLKDNLQNLLTN